MSLWRGLLVSLLAAAAGSLAGLPIMGTLTVFTFPFTLLGSTAILLPAFFLMKRQGLDRGLSYFMLAITGAASGALIMALLFGSLPVVGLGIFFGLSTTAAWCGLHFLMTNSDGETSRA